MISEEQIKNMLELMKNGIHYVKKDMPGMDLLKKAQQIILGDVRDSRIHLLKPYLLTTQNLRYIQKTLPDKADSAFTILGAGNNVFELVRCNVKNIVAVDVNELQLLIYYLHYASILTLSAKDYENFLINTTSSKFLSLDVLKNIEDAFKGNEKYFNVWKELLSINPLEDLMNYFLKNVGGDPSKVRYSLPYLGNKKEFYALKSKLENANIAVDTAEALEYLNSLDRKFDYIDITNILLFIYQARCNNNDEEFQQELQKLRKIFEYNLNDGGTFILDYFFGVALDSDFSNMDMLIKPIYNAIADFLKNNFDLESIQVEKQIPGFGNDLDSVILTRKKLTQLRGSPCGFS